MSKAKINKAYKYRLYPTAEQEVLLAKHFGACRWMYNYGLEQKIKSHAETGRSLNRYEISSHLPKLKKEKEWLKEINSQSLQHKLICLESGMEKFFKEKKGFPQFKSKWNKQSFTVPQHFELDGSKLRLPKFRKGIAIVVHREFTGKICSVTISKTASGKYHASLLTEQDLVIEQKPVERDTALGLDVGLTDFVIISNGQKIERKKYIKNSANKLKRLQRKLCKQQKGSNNRNKTKRKIAVVHEKIANKRNDYLHKVTRQLINESQVNTYCIEDLNVLGMLKNHKLAQSISDVSWSEFVRQLKYKAGWEGKNVIQIGRFEASSKTCSHCGKVNNNLTLSDRIWKCDCGIEHDRDINAAINIKNFAFNGSKIIGQELSESEPVEKECCKTLHRNRKREQLAAA